MQTGAITQYIDVAQLVLYAFWIVFAGLIYFLHRENKREGYPLDNDRSGSVKVQGFPAVPAPKTYHLRDGRTVHAPRAPALPPATLRGRPSGAWLGAPLVPDGDALTAEIGPGAYALRADIPDIDVDGRPRIRPLRLVPDNTVADGDPDPRGLPVVGADGVVGGTVVELWLDTSEQLFRYYEVEVAGMRRVLVPVNFARVDRRRVRVRSLLGAQLANVPGQREPDVVTQLEEERIVAYFGAGTLYATARRAEPLL